MIYVKRREEKKRIGVKNVRGMEGYLQASSCKNYSKRMWEELWQVGFKGLLGEVSKRIKESFDIKVIVYT